MKERVECLKPEGLVDARCYCCSYCQQVHPLGPTDTACQASLSFHDLDVKPNPRSVESVRCYAQPSHPSVNAFIDIRVQEMSQHM